VESPPKPSALAAHLTAAGQEVILTREPGWQPGGRSDTQPFADRRHRQWSAETELLLFTRGPARITLSAPSPPALSAGKIVVCDRFADSTRVYQGANPG
jgi:dTMP kinase